MSVKKVYSELETMLCYIDRYFYILTRTEKIRFLERSKLIMQAYKTHHYAIVAAKTLREGYETIELIEMPKPTQKQLYKSLRHIRELLELYDEYVIIIDNRIQKSYMSKI